MYGILDRLDEEKIIIRRTPKLIDFYKFLQQFSEHIRFGVAVMAEKAENGHTVVQSNETHSQAIELRISGDDATGSNPAVSASTSSQSNLIDDQQEEVEHQFFKCCQNSVAAHCCIDDWRSKSIEDPKTGEEIDTQLEIVLVPEAFRMWFYYGWYMNI